MFASIAKFTFGYHGASEDTIQKRSIFVNTCIWYWIYILIIVSILHLFMSFDVS